MEERRHREACAGPKQRTPGSAARVVSPRPRRHRRPEPEQEGSRRQRGGHGSRSRDQPPQRVLVERITTGARSMRVSNAVVAANAWSFFQRASQQPPAARRVEIITAARMTAPSSSRLAPCPKVRNADVGTSAVPTPAMISSCRRRPGTSPWRRRDNRFPPCVRIPGRSQGGAGPRGSDVGVFARGT